MTAKKKRAQQKASHKKSGIVPRIGCFALIVAGAIAAYIAIARPPWDKMPLIGPFLQQYRQVKAVSDRLSSITWEATLCFGDENADYLVKEFRKIMSLPQPEHKAAALVKELITGPKARGVRTLPPEVKLRAITKDEDVLTVDLSEDLIIRHPGGSTSEMMTVFSLVNTLTINIPEIRRVKLLVEGRPVDTIAGHIDCKDPIAPQPGLVH